MVSLIFSDYTPGSRLLPVEYITVKTLIYKLSCISILMFVIKGKVFDIVLSLPHNWIRSSNAFLDMPHVPVTNKLHSVLHVFTMILFARKGILSSIYPLRLLSSLWFQMYIYTKGICSWSDVTLKLLLKLCSVRLYNSSNFIHKCLTLKKCLHQLILHRHNKWQLFWM